MLSVVCVFSSLAMVDGPLVIDGVSLTSLTVTVSWCVSLRPPESATFTVTT